MNLHTVISLRISPELKQRADQVKLKHGKSQPEIFLKGVEYYENSDPEIAVKRVMKILKSKAEETR